MDDLIKEYKRLIFEYLDQGYTLCDAQDKSGALMADKYGIEVFCHLPWFIDFDF